MKKVFIVLVMLLCVVCVFPLTAGAAEPEADFTPEIALEHLKKAIEQRMPYGYYLKDEDYETKDDEFLKHEDDVYLLETSTEQIRGGVAYCFEFHAFRLFGGHGIVFADGTVELDIDESYNDYIYLFPFE